MFVSTDVAVPQVLRDWSTVGSTSVSVVWRCNSNVQNVDAFLLYYRPLHDVEKRRHTPKSLDLAHLATRTDADLGATGFSRIRVHRFVPKRSQAVIRNLQSATDYVLILYAVNHLARSPPSVYFFQTAPSDGNINKRTLSRRRPVGLTLCDRLMALVARVVHVSLKVLLFSYIFISALLIVVYHDTMYNDLCYIFNWTELSAVICAVSSDEPSAAELHTAQEPSYFVWLYDLFTAQKSSYFVWLYDLFSE